MHWFLTGEFGGVGGTESQITDEGVMVSTQYEGKPATGLRAVLYAPGCEMQLVRVDNLRLEDTPRESEFACRKVARIKLEGKVDPTEVSFDEDSEVRVDYVANWVNPFMGIMDGPVMELEGGRASINKDGSFSVDLAGFGLDPISYSTGKDADFQVSVTSRKSGDFLAWLRVNGPLRAENDRDLKVQAAYPDVVRFLP